MKPQRAWRQGLLASAGLCSALVAAQPASAPAAVDPAAPVSRAAVKAEARRAEKAGEIPSGELDSSSATPGLTGARAGEAAKPGNAPAARSKMRRNARRAASSVEGAQPEAKRP